MNQDGLKPSWVKLRDQEEQIKDLKQIVADYDAYLHELFPHVYAYYKKPAQLRARAREEGIDIKEPQP